MRVKDVKGVALYLSDNGIEFIFDGFLDINLIIMFLFVVEVSFFMFQMVFVVTTVKECIFHRREYPPLTITIMISISIYSS